MIIKIVRLGQAIQEAKLPAGTTVADAVAAACDGLELTIDAVSNEIRVNGQKVDDDTVLEDGDIVTAVPAAKGGNL